MNNDDKAQNDAYCELNGAVGRLLPGGRLERFTIPDSGGMALSLLNADYARAPLAPDEAARVMDNPLYWVFCWASGAALAAFLHEHGEWVAGKRVLDFGSGSGVVAIAAARAGAGEVIACDSDPLALRSTALNARHNGVEVACVDNFAAVSGPLDTILVADVLYDRDNLHWLHRFRQRAGTVLVADSRVRDFDVPPYRQIDTRESCTLPDLDESSEFRHVRLYCAGAAPCGWLTGTTRGGPRHSA